MACGGMWLMEVCRCGLWKWVWFVEVGVACVQCDGSDVVAGSIIVMCVTI